MKRFAIITVGKTHSGKTTFAKNLEYQLDASLVIDQDNHAEFINAHYKTLLPKKGPNTFKYALTQTIADYVINHTDFHLILSNSNLNYQGRSNLLKDYHKKGFKSVLVNFDIPYQVLQARIAESRRGTNILRTATTFDEVLIRQQTMSKEDYFIEPSEDEADYLFVINSVDEVETVIRSIINVIHSEA